MTNSITQNKSGIFTKRYGGILFGLFITGCCLAVVAIAFIGFTASLYINCNGGWHCVWANLWTLK
jgi:hypothetical protein